MHVGIKKINLIIYVKVGELQMDRASFRKEKDCLVLDVPPLSPYTSKLVAGDMLIASLPGAAGIL